MVSLKSYILENVSPILTRLKLMTLSDHLRYFPLLTIREPDPEGMNQHMYKVPIING